MMVDLAHKEVDKRIEELERKFAREYQQAYEEISEKAQNHFDKFAKEEAKRLKKVEEGKLSEADYKKWRKLELMKGKRWTELKNQMAERITKANVSALQAVSEEIAKTFVNNANYTSYLIENNARINYGFTLYDETTVQRLIQENPDLLPAPKVDIPLDLRWNKQKIVSAITQGILQGESAKNLAKRLQKVTNMNASSALTNARTAMTSAQNAGRQEVYDKAKKMGLKLKKEWVATLDGRTRHEHGDADGQRVELDEEFVVGGKKMMFPGDRHAPPHLVYNCRCTTITVEPEHITKGEEPRKTYKEWLKEKGDTAKKKENERKSKRQHR